MDCGRIPNSKLIKLKSWIRLCTHQQLYLSTPNPISKRKARKDKNTAS